MADLETCLRFIDKLQWDCDVHMINETDHFIVVPIDNKNVYFGKDDVEYFNKLGYHWFVNQNKFTGQFELTLDSTR